MNYEIVIDGSTFGNNAPIAIVNVSGSNVTSIKNCKSGLFRLGTGGANPNISHVHSFMVDPENNILATTNSSPDPFAGGDWELQNFKDWADRVMTEFKQIKNSKFWYGTNTLVPDVNLSDLFFDVAGSKITGAGSWKHSDVTPGLLTWTSNLNIRSIFGKMTLTIPQGSVAMSDLDVAYISYVRNQDFQPANTFTFTNGSTTVSGTLNITGISAGDYVKYEAHDLISWTKVTSVTGTTMTLSDPYPGANAVGKALRTQGSYTMQVASPNNVPVSSNTYWIAKRDDNAFATKTIAAPGSNGLERASDIVTVITTAAHGLVEGQSFAVAGASDTSFNGTFDVATVVSATSFTYYNPGGDVGPGIAGNGSVSAIAKIYLRLGSGVGELQQGEDVQIDDETTLNILKFIGAENETDTTPPYTIVPNLLSTHHFTSNNNLTQAISQITGNVNDIFTTLNQPAYDEPLIVVSGAPSSSNEVTGPILSGATITLPLHSRKASAVQNYVVGKGYLEVSLNGQKLTLNQYGTGSLTSFAANGMGGPFSADYAFNGSVLGGAAVTVTPGANQNFSQMLAVLSRANSGVAAGNIVCRVRNNAGGVPGATVLGTSNNSIAVSTLPTVGTTAAAFTFSTPVALTSGVQYWFCIETDATYQAGDTSYVIWSRPTGGGTPNASATNNGTSWATSINLTPSFELDSTTLSTIGNGWTEVGFPLADSNQIIINQDLPVGDVLSFRIDGPGGPGATAGAPDDDFHNLPFSGSTNPATEILIWDADVSQYRKETRLSFLAGVSNAKQVNTYATNHTANATSDDVMLMNAVGGALIVSLPAAASAIGKVFDIKKIDASGNTVTIDPSGSETIDGATTFVLTAQYQSRSIVSDGVSWWII